MKLHILSWILNNAVPVSRFDLRNWVEGNCRNFKASTIEIIGYHIWVLNFIKTQALSSRSSYVNKGSGHADQGLQGWGIMACTVGVWRKVSLVVCLELDPGSQEGLPRWDHDWLGSLRMLWCPPYRGAGCQEFLTRKAGLPNNFRSTDMVSGE